MLDVISHRPDMPLLARGPFLGLGLWNSVTATPIVGLTLYACALVYFVRGNVASKRPSFWLLIVFWSWCISARRSVHHPERTNRRDLRTALWLLLPWAAWADRAKV